MVLLLLLVVVILFFHSTARGGHTHGGCGGTEKCLARQNGPTGSPIQSTGGIAVGRVCERNDCVACSNPATSTQWVVSPQGRMGSRGKDGVEEGDGGRMAYGDGVRTDT